MHLNYAVETYLATLTNETTKKNYKVALEEIAKGITYLIQVTPARIQAYKKYLIAQGKAMQTITAKLAAVRSFCDFCWMQGWFSENPGFEVQPEKVVKYGNAKKVSFNDFQKLLGAIEMDSAEGIRDLMLLRVVFLVGDHNKALALKWSNKLPEALQKYKQLFKEKLPTNKKIDFKDGFLFFSLDSMNNTKPISYATARRILLRRLEKAGFETNYMDFPALKRLRAKQIYEKTKSAKAVQQFCGHKSLRITREFIKTL